MGKKSKKKKGNKKKASPEDLCNRAVREYTAGHPAAAVSLFKRAAALNHSRGAERPRMRAAIRGHATGVRILLAAVAFELPLAAAEIGLAVYHAARAACRGSGQLDVQRSTLRIPSTAAARTETPLQLSGGLRGREQLPPRARCGVDLPCRRIHVQDD